MIDPSIPFIDLHRHLDGSIRLETIIDLGRQYNLALPAWDVDGLRPFVQVTEPQPGVMAFISRFHWMIQVLVDYEACRRVAYENVEDARDEGLDYVELRFSPMFMAESHALDPEGVVEAVCDGIAAGKRDFDLPVKLIGILSRTYGPELAWKELQALLGWKDQLTGLDLAGDEAHFPAKLFREHFQAGRQAGWEITIHAGEIAGPESIWQAIQDLQASRIGHAVAAQEDPVLMDYMVDHAIAIEGNLTSNVQTMTTSDYASHPLRRFHEHGICVTLNTDDPGISGITLAYEYNLAAPAAGFNPSQIQKLQANALQAAFLTEAEKTALLKKKSSL